jgi:hypothetical protein
VDQWNQLPKLVAEAPSVNTFKNAVDVYLEAKFNKFVQYGKVLLCAY